MPEKPQFLGKDAGQDSFEFLRSLLSQIKRHQKVRLDILQLLRTWYATFRKT